MGLAGSPEAAWRPCWSRPATPSSSSLLALRSRAAFSKAETRPPSSTSRSSCTSLIRAAPMRSAGGNITSGVVFHAPFRKLGGSMWLKLTTKTETMAAHLGPNSLHCQQNHSKERLPTKAVTNTVAVTAGSGTALSHQTPSWMNRNSNMDVAAIAIFSSVGSRCAIKTLCANPTINVNTTMRRLLSGVRHISIVASMDIPRTTVAAKRIAPRLESQGRACNATMISGTMLKLRPTAITNRRRQ
mmetsp:Transcript_15050/g.30639  ORF Transcript_15050/g.30639 Transcript_15050/m.30639 type:complete len:243 (-) Transcript_15050:38-766(-)